MKEIRFPKAAVNMIERELANRERRARRERESEQARQRRQSRAGLASMPRLSKPAEGEGSLFQ
jgi:hypothetical protein